MDIRKPEDTERSEQNFKLEAELAEAKLRSLERAKAKSEPLSDVHFTDKAGRPITIRTWESGNQAFVRAYDTSKVQVPERVNIGQAGYANAALEQMPDGQSRVRLNDIVTSPEYRNVGVGGEMLNQVEQYARKNNATEIYGSIDSQEAQNYWHNQVEHGWTIDYSKGAYGEVHKKM